MTPSITMRLGMVILLEGFGSKHPYQLILMHLKSLELLVSVSFIFKFYLLMSSLKSVFGQLPSIMCGGVELLTR